MNLVDNHVAPRPMKGPCNAQFVGEQNALWGIGSAVGNVKTQVGGGIVHPVREMAGSEAETSIESFCVGIDEQLVGIEAMAVGRFIGPMNTIAVPLAGLDCPDMGLPNIATSVQLAAG